MTNYIAILRGINVSGQRKIKMEDLKELLAELKLTNIRTYIQSGNLAFEHESIAPEELAQRIETKIQDSYGFEVPVLVMPQQKMITVLQDHPFPTEIKEDISKLHVTFLAEIPQAAEMEALQELEQQFLPDAFYLSGKEVYLYCPNGYGRTKLNNNFFERKLKVKATTRNWKTVEKLANL